VEAREGAVDDLVVNHAFWRGRRVLVTGHTGFKGGWLTVWLRALGAEITGLALAPPTVPSLFESATVYKGIQSCLVDINDFRSTRRVIGNAQPEVVFHLAAQPLVRLSYDQPLETLSTNVLGTAHVLEALRQVDSARAVVVITSDKCYENREWFWSYRESEPLGGRDLYSCSKGCAELVSHAYRKSFLSATGTHVATARAGNVHGGGDWAADRLLPDMIRAFQAGESAPIRNPDAVRPWQHVLEPLLGYLLLAERLHSDGEAYAEAWNFGPNVESERTVAEVANRVTRVWGNGAKWYPRAEQGAPYEANFLKLDSSKARMRLGWAAKWDLDEGLRRTVDWYRRFSAGGNVRALTEQQIFAYDDVRPR
jgi:CDP-glucose 4,6-dehydratase